MTNEQKWELLWNHDVQFGFVCGAFAGVFALVLMFCALDLLAGLVAGRRRPQQAPQQRVARYSSQGGPNGQSWRR